MSRPARDVTLSASDIEAMAAAIRAQLIDQNGGDEAHIETQAQIARSIESALEELIEDMVKDPLSVMEGGPFGNGGPLPAYNRRLDYHSGAQLRRIQARNAREKAGAA